MPMYDTPQEAFKELARRVKLLKKAPTAFKGLVTRMGAAQLVEMRVEAASDVHEPHNSYAFWIDLFKSDRGVQVGVAQAKENVALAAEIGTKTTRQDPLWRPGFRRAQKQADQLAQALLEAIAERVEAGEGIDVDLIEGVSPRVLLGSTGMPQTREILSALRQQERREL